MAASGGACAVTVDANAADRGECPPATLAGDRWAFGLRSAAIASSAAAVRRLSAVLLQYAGSAAVELHPLVERRADRGSSATCPLPGTAPAAPSAAASGPLPLAGLHTPDGAPALAEGAAGTWQGQIIG